jgi:hypothetical protein
MAKILDIKFNEDEKDMLIFQDLFNTIGRQALLMSHYDLADMTDESPIDWKRFLTDARVSAFIAEEMELLKKSKVAKMLNTIDSNKNTGQAQLLNTLLNQTRGEDRKDGPVFIYTQVPLNNQEKGAEHTVIYNESNSTTNRES